MAVDVARFCAYLPQEVRSMQPILVTTTREGRFMRPILKQERMHDYDSAISDNNNNFNLKVTTSKYFSN